MIQLSCQGPVFERDAAWEATSRDFAERHCVVLPQFVDAALLQRILRMLAEGEFEDEETTSLGSVFAREVALAQKSPVPRLFQLLLNNPVLFAPIQELVDCRAHSFPGRKDVGDGRVSGFHVGRCFKMMPGGHHFDSWHTDLKRGRQVGLSVNLEPDPTAAGGLEIQHRPAPPSPALPPHRVVPGFGDALLFRIAPGLWHRGLPPAGAVAKCAFSGWFVSGSSLGLARKQAAMPATSASKRREAARRSKTRLR